MDNTVTNIGYWEKVLKNPTKAFIELFDEEEKYLISNVPKNSYLLDVACGDGSTIQKLLTQTKNIVGIDNDPKAVLDAQSKLKSNSGVKILLADAFSLPFPDNSFDVVIHLMTLVNFENNKVLALKEMSRVLRDDGKIIISVYSEEALDDRLEMYKQIGVPIKEVVGTRVIFDESVGANESEQFSLDEIKEISVNAGLKITDYKKISNIAYILNLKK